MIEIQWWDFKGMPRTDEAAAVDQKSVAT